MANWIIGFLAGISVGTWIYTKSMRRTGNNTKNSLIVAGFIGFFVFVVVWSIVVMVDSALGN